MPVPVQKKFKALAKDIQMDGPFQKAWPNFSRLGIDSYHCHLSYRWVVCWLYRKDKIEVEIYCAGSRENAPY
jgi:hypothetical protein